MQVSTDGGATYTTHPGRQDHRRAARAGLNGTTAGFEPHAFDLSAYAGQNVLIAFRYVSDGGVNEGGLLIDDITVGGTLISDGSSLEPFDSPTEVHPTEVHNWNVRLVGINEGRKPVVLQVEFDGQNSLQLREAARHWPARSTRSSPSSRTTSRPSRCSSTRRTRSR